MKTFLKKISCIILATVMILGTVPMSVSAASGITYDKNVTSYCSGKNDISSSVSIYVGNIPASQTIKKSSVKIVSGKNVVSLSSLYRSRNDYWTDYIKKGQKSKKTTSTSYSIGLNIKKTGTAKVAFKVGNKTYTSTVRILPYTNPIASFTLTGVKNASSSNLAGKFKNNANANIKVNKAQKNAMITCKAVSGWKITRIDFANKNTNIARNIYKENGVSSISFYAGNLAAGQKGYIDIDLVNVKTKATQYCSLNLGDSWF